MMIVVDSSSTASALTFDMRGGRQPAKPDVARPLDGRVRARPCMDPAALRASTAPDGQGDRERTRILNWLTETLIHALPLFEYPTALNGSEILLFFVSYARPMCGVARKGLRLTALAGA